MPERREEAVLSSQIEGTQSSLSDVLLFEEDRRRIGVSAPTVAKSLEHMQRLGMLREITGRQRHRLFVYEAYLAMLSEGTEPIR